MVSAPATTENTTAKAPAGDDSRGLLRSSLTPFAAVLAAPGFVLAGCPFESHPAQHRTRTSHLPSLVVASGDDSLARRRAPAGRSPGAPPL
ncbi:hypothetical protein JCM17823_23010 [Halorubrum gandharaense]